MEARLRNYEHLKIELEEIKSATDNFSDKNCIGEGGFGKVYKGKVSHYEGRSMVAIKCLNRKQGQGDAEFLKEVRTLSHYKHENLISLLGFCYQGDEAILVYQLASCGSLDEHLGSHELTWTKRLKICLGGAKGLSHLHDPKDTHQRLIHCDVKSGNILLDDNWTAKVADFGFSIMGPANELQSTIINLAAGTVGYCDPQYALTNTLTKESDVYSFGVVLVEVFCGALCYTITNDSVEYSLVPTWIKSYEEKKLDDIIFKCPTIHPMHQSTIEIFSDIAYQCLNETPEERPEMAEIVSELETALECQELTENQEFIGEWNKQHCYYKKIAKRADSPLNYRSEVHLKQLLSRSSGVLLNSGKTWFSLNDEGEHCEMISVAASLGLDQSYLTEFKSRFPLGTYLSYNGRFNIHVKAQFLSPGITYTVNLVFKYLNQRFVGERDVTIPAYLKYKLQGEKETSTSYHVYYDGKDGWMRYELYQYTSQRRTVDLRIQFDGFGKYTHKEVEDIEVEGIEFRPLEKLDDKQPISDSDSDANWEEKLPADYEDIMKWSTSSVKCTTKEETYSIMSKGFLISDEQKRSIWFSIGKNGKKSLMISGAHICEWYRKYTRPSPESRFGEVLDRYDCSEINIRTKFRSQLVSSETKYAMYLVYKLHEDHFGFEGPMLLELRGHILEYIYIIAGPKTRVIKPKVDQNTQNPLSMPIIKGLPQPRNDGWMEVQLWEFQTSTTIDLDLDLTYHDRRDFGGLIIEGIDFRPI